MIELKYGFRSNVSVINAFYFCLLTYPPMQVEFITTEQTYPLRQSVLHPGMPFESILVNKDNSPGTFHLGVFLNGNIISIGSFNEVKSPLFSYNSQFQLRKMATSPDHRNLNAGRALLWFGIKHLKQKNVQLLWCNAREIALGFYEKIGFKTGSDFFDITGIGPHKVLYFEL